MFPRTEKGVELKKSQEGYTTTLRASANQGGARGSQITLRPTTAKNYSTDD
jgi:hypothetical protein